MLPKYLKYCLPAFVLALSGVSYADPVYKWVDETGVVQFGEKAPEGVAAQRLDVQPLPKSGLQLGPIATDVYDVPAGGPSSDPPVANSPTRPAPRLFEAQCLTFPSRCFDNKDQRVCAMRYGNSCEAIVFWKTRLEETCQRRFGRKCTGKQLFEERPSSILMRDFDSQFALDQNTSGVNRSCLVRSGFLCSELKDESVCRAQYAKSCDELSNWVASATQECMSKGNADCSSVDFLQSTRPVSVEERELHGIVTVKSDVRRRSDKVMKFVSPDEKNPKHESLLEAAVMRFPGQ